MHRSGRCTSTPVMPEIGVRAGWCRSSGIRRHRFVMHPPTSLGRAVAVPRQHAPVGHPAAMPNALAALGNFIRRKPLGAFGAAIIVLLMITAIGAQWLAPYSYDVGVTADRDRGFDRGRWVTYTGWS